MQSANVAHLLVQQLKIGRQSYKTQVVTKNLNPVWNETFTLDVNTQGSILEVSPYHDPSPRPCTPESPARC